MLEMGTSGLMSGEGKQPAACRSRPSARPRLYTRRILNLLPSLNFWDHYSGPGAHRLRHYTASDIFANDVLRSLRLLILHFQVDSVPWRNLYYNAPQPVD